MNSSHSRARQSIHAAAFQALDSAEQAALEGHLQSCPQCAQYAVELPRLEGLLANSLQKRWPKPARIEDVYSNGYPDIQRLVKRRQMRLRVNNIARTIAWAGVILVFILVTNWAISNIRADQAALLLPTSTTQGSTSMPVAGFVPTATETPDNKVASEQSEGAISRFTPTPTPTKIAGHKRVLEKLDLNCDGDEERLSGITGSSIPYFDTDQWQTIKLETLSDHGPTTVYEQTAVEAGVAYLFYEIYSMDPCHQFLVLIGYRGKERIKVFHWDGKQLNKVLDRPGTFFTSDTLSVGDFGIETVPPQTFITYEYTYPTVDLSVVWTLWGFEWDGERLIQTIEKRKCVHGGG
jgi:hypothetical protein